jgi:sec-independent protein translocase protein TatB
MFDVGMFEMILIGVIALLILGPERMPEAARSAGRMVGKLRGFISGVKADVKDQMSVTELEELRQLRNDLASAKTELNQLQKTTGNNIGDSIPSRVSGDESDHNPNKPDNDTNPAKTKSNSPDKKKTSNQA